MQDGTSPDFLETDSKLGDTTDFFIATVIGESCRTRQHLEVL